MPMPHDRSRRDVVGPLARVAGLLLLLLALLAPAPADAWDPEITWKTLETPHFRLHYPTEAEALARTAASKLEVIHTVMTEELGWEPRRYTDVVLSDHTDTANGFAATLPNNTITIYLTAPMDGNALDYYEEWLTALLLHEYTHILHIDTIEGFPALLRRVFGRLIMTNDVYPRWIVEGYAVYQETVNTRFGRGRSTMTDMLLRMATLEKPPLTLGEAEGFGRDWPRGNIRYLWGGRFMAWVALTYGRDKWVEFSHVHARALNPLALNWHARKVFGKTLYALWDEWQAHLAETYSAERAAWLARGPLEGDVRVASPGSVGALAFSPDGAWIYFTQASETGPGGIYRMPASGGEPSLVLERRLPRTLAFSPDGRVLYFAEPAEFTLYTEHMDVWAWDVEAEALRRLSWGARARDPAVDPTGQRLLVVTNTLGTTNLAWLLPGGRLQPLTHHTDGTQYGTPVWSPDGDSFAVSTWTVGGRRDIQLFDASGVLLAQITQDIAVDLDPSFSPDGAYVLFSSDRTGVSNLYAYERATGRLFQLTDVLSGAFEPRVSPDGTHLLYRGYTADGYDLRLMAWDPTRWREVADWIPPRRFGVWPSPTLAGARLPGEAPPETWGAPRPYNPLPSLLPPRLLAPQVYIAESGFLVLGALTYGRDALGHHSYQLWANYRTDSGFVSWGGSYAYGRLRPALGLSASTNAVLLGNLLGYPLPDGSGTSFQGYFPRDYAYFEVRTRAAATVSLPMEGNRSTWVQYSLECREPLDPVPGVDDQGWSPAPFDCPEPLGTVPPGYFEGGIPDRGSFAGISAGWRRRTTRGYARSISPEDGRSLSFTGQVQSRYLGADYERQVITVDWRGYETVPLVERLGLHNHVIAWRLAAGAGLGDRLGQASFRLGGNFGTSPFVIVPPEFYPLRGYGVATDIGDRMVLGSLEYRLPLIYVDRGLGTLPFFFRDLSLSIFTDAGHAFEPFGLERGLLDPAAWAEVVGGARVGTGAELNAQAVIGYGLPFGVRLGYGVGWQGGFAGDLSSLYLQIGSSF